MEPGPGRKRKVRVAKERKKKAYKVTVAVVAPTYLVILAGIPAIEYKQVEVLAYSHAQAIEIAEAKANAALAAAGL